MWKMWKNMCKIDQAWPMYWTMEPPHNHYAIVKLYSN